MDNQFFLNHPGMPLTTPPPPLPPLQFDHPTMPTWQSLSSSSPAAAAAAVMDIHMMTIPSSSDHLFPHQSSPDRCFFDSALSSMVSSPTNTNTTVNGFAIKELIGRLGNIYTGLGDLSPPSSSAAAAVIGSSCNNSCYSTPLSSPKMVQHQQTNIASSDHFPAPVNYQVVGGNSLLPAMPGDPGFAERAARFSSFGSRSFNGRSTTPTATINNGMMSPTTGGVSGSCPGFPPKSPGAIGGRRSGAKLQRVLSSPSLKVAIHNHNNSNGTTTTTRSTVHEGEAFTTPDRKTSRFGGAGQFGNSREENGDVVAVVRGSSSRKRKSSSSSAALLQKGKEEKEDCSDAKRCNEKNNKTDEEKARVEEEKEEEEEIGNKKKQSKSNNNSKVDPKQKKIIDEAPKDYIHVRARRGQATDSHSLAERVRREKISERMKLLQDLVPGCNKVVGKALMLEEIINYVQSLQRQVEFLSMKLATVNPKMEFNGDSGNANVFRKDRDWSMQHQQQQAAAAGSSYPMTQIGYGGHGHHQSLQQQQLHYHHQHHQQQQSVADIEIPMELLINNNNNTNGFTTTDHHHHHRHTVVPEEQLPSLCEGDDLEAIVEMGRRLIGTHSTTTDVDI